MKIINIVGARPNLMKIAPLMEAYRGHAEIAPLLVHTGQHYDANMSEFFFRQLGIPEPDLNLEVGSASHAVQTAEIMQAFEPIVLEHQPDVVLVVGDVDSTIACGIVAVKLGVRLVHVEAGLRSFDRDMPEEINRLLTDAISDLLLCSEPSGVENLRREGVAEEKIHLVGNVMIDTLLKHRERAQASTILADYGLEEGGYAVLTLHRPSNVDDPEILAGLLDAFEVVAAEGPIVPIEGQSGGDRGPTRPRIGHAGQVLHDVVEGGGRFRAALPGVLVNILPTLDPLAEAHSEREAVAFAFAVLLVVDGHDVA